MVLIPANSQQLWAPPTCRVGSVIATSCRTFSDTHPIRLAQAMLPRAAMRIWFVRSGSIVLSALLQLSPLLRVATAEAVGVRSPLAVLLRGIAGASALAGSVHAVSGATGLTLTGTTKGTNGLAFAGARVSVNSSFYGIAQSYSASGMPAGLTMSKQGVVTGTPTQVGVFVAAVTGWKKSNTSGHSYSSPVSFQIEAQAVAPPALTQSPQPLIVVEGSPATFSVVASGLPPPTLQWFFNGVPIAGAAGAQFQIAQTVLTNAGNYSVIARNPGGAVTSAPVTLTILPEPKPPTITLQPASQSVPAGGKATFSVIATGTAPLAFQWTYKGVDVPSETNSTLILSPVVTNQSGSYQVRVSNSVSSLLSAVAILSVIPVTVEPFTLNAPQFTDGLFRFTFQTQPEVNYLVEAGNSLTGTPWTTVTNLPASAAAGTAVIADRPADPARFYRVRTNP